MSWLSEQSDISNIKSDVCNRKVKKTIYQDQKNSYLLQENGQLSKQCLCIKSWESEVASKLFFLTFSFDGKQMLYMFRTMAFNLGCTLDISWDALKNNTLRDSDFIGLGCDLGLDSFKSSSGETNVHPRLRITSLEAV